MSGTTGQGSPSLSDSTILQLQNEIARLKARVDMASLARDDYRKRLKRSEQELDALKAENERLLSVVDAKIQDLARANEVGVALVRERDQALEALREVLACRIIPTCDGMHHEPNDQHGYETSCPVVERYQIAMIKAQKALQGGEGEVNP